MDILIFLNADVNQFQSFNYCRASRSAKSGILRGFTDFSIATLSADLAVVRDFQNQGIGRGFLEEARKQSALDARFFCFCGRRCRRFFYQKLGFPASRAMLSAKAGERLLWNFIQKWLTSNSTYQT